MRRRTSPLALGIAALLALPACVVERDTPGRGLSVRAGGGASGVAALSDSLSAGAATGGPASLPAGPVATPVPGQPLNSHVVVEVRPLGSVAYDGQVLPTHSVSAGLDYPSIGPEHAWLHETGRAEYAWVTDDEALDAFETLGRTEGILPALESAHAVAWLMREGPRLPEGAIAIVNLSGRGDKDIHHASAELATRR